MPGKILVKISSECQQRSSSSNGKHGKQLKPLNGEKMDIDEYTLRMLFQDMYGSNNGDITIQSKMGRKTEELQRFISDIPKDPFDIYIFVFLGYKDDSSSPNGEVIETHNGYVTLEDITNWLKNIPQVHGKPKICLIQADDVSLLAPPPGTKGGGPSPPKQWKKIPSDADRLVVLSTLPQGLAAQLPPTMTQMSSTETGNVMGQPTDNPSEPKPSLMIQAFCDVLRGIETGPEDFLTQTAYMNGMIADCITELEKTNSDYQKLSLEVPLVMSTLTKPVHISP